MAWDHRWQSLEWVRWYMIDSFPSTCTSLLDPTLCWLLDHLIEHWQRSFCLRIRSRLVYRIYALLGHQMTSSYQSNSPRSQLSIYLVHWVVVLSWPKHVHLRYLFQQLHKRQGQTLGANCKVRLHDLLNRRNPINIWVRLHYQFKLTLDRNDCIECQTSTLSVPGASSLWNGIKLTKRAAWRGDSRSLSAIIGAISVHTGL